MITTLVFTRTKHKARKLAQQLARTGTKATCIQGNLSQTKRQKALDGFKDGTFNVLVATDIAARGIDVSGISHVINYDVPDTAEAYIHRTGRTGRAKHSGRAISFVTEKDTKIIRIIERKMGKDILKLKAPGMAAPAPSITEEESKETARAQARSRNRRRSRAKSKTQATATKEATTPKKATDKKEPPKKAAPKKQTQKKTAPKKKTPANKAPAKKTRPPKSKPTQKAATKSKANKNKETATTPAPEKKKAPPKPKKATPKQPQRKSKARDACPMPLSILGHGKEK